MAIGIWCELVCARCAETNTGRFSFDSRVPRKELMADARANGWQFVNNESFCSQACVEKFRREQYGNS